MQSSKEIVKRAIQFESPQRLPRDMWALPWAQIHFPNELKTLQQQYPSDIAMLGSQGLYNPSLLAAGDPFAVGVSTDDWGCCFENRQAGVIGEVKDPILKTPEDVASYQPPYNILPTNISAFTDGVNRQYAQKSQFVLAGCLARPWERYQFLRGTEEAMMDMILDEKSADALLKKIHDYYLREMELWLKTNVDGIFFMDDWGSQTQLLIRPDCWRQKFKPLYRDYCDRIHAAGKFAFMHTDGYIAEIIPDLIEIGVDAINSQIFCMDMDFLRREAKGKITFWGEIDRQHVLVAADPEIGRQAVRKVYDHLYSPDGGIIIQFEVGPGANPKVAHAVFEEWDRLCLKSKINKI